MTVSNDLVQAIPSHVIRYETRVEFGAGYWWANVYQAGWKTPMASFGPCTTSEQVVQLQLKVDLWLQKFVRHLIQEKMASTQFTTVRVDTRGAYDTTVGFPKWEREHDENTGAVTRVLVSVPQETKRE